MREKFITKMEDIDKVILACSIKLGYLSKVNISNMKLTKENEELV